MAIGGKTGDIFTEINVTPLTDVFLVLLVIMILVAPLVNQTVLKVDPPAASANPNVKPPDEKNKIDVEVYGSGIIKINGTPVPPSRPEDLSMNIQQMIAAEQQKAGSQDIPLNLASEPDAVEKNVVAVMDAAAGAGIKQMRVLPLRQLGGK